MALSDYELQVLRDLEAELQRPRHPRWRRIGRACRAYESAIIVGMLAAMVVAAVFSLGADVAPVAGVLCAVTGYLVAVGRRRLMLRMDHPER